MKYYISKMPKLINLYPYAIPSFKTSDLIPTEEVRLRLLPIFLIFFPVKLALLFLYQRLFPLLSSPPSFTKRIQLIFPAPIQIPLSQRNSSHSPKASLPITLFQDTLLFSVIPIMLGVTYSRSPPSLDCKSQVVKTIFYV